MASSLCSVASSTFLAYFELGLERVDHLGILEVLDAPIAEVLLEDLDPALDRVGAPQVGRLHLPLEIEVEEAGDQLRVDDLRPLDRGLRPRIAARLDLADEEALPVARLLDRLDGPLLPDLHPRDGEVVRRHPVPGPSEHHVEPQVLQAPAAVAAFPAALAPDGHTPSFIVAPFVVASVQNPSSPLAAD